jgi:GTP pyrophosphokinase/guanosine-3',5'-bis(diphosphate) 3'-pyrophosphohydrolase
MNTWITASTSHPNPSWLNFVTTAKARSSIRQYLKHLRNEDAELLGRRLLNKHLNVFSSVVEELSEERISQVLEEFELDNFEQLLGELGLGNRSALVVAQKLTQNGTSVDEEPVAPLIIAGTEGLVVSFARCCHPIPGDPIHGFISAGRGIVVHQASCKNTLKLRAQNEKWLDVTWADDVSREFPVDISIHAKNQRGVLATIAVAVSEMDSNIDNVIVDERDGGHSDLHLTIEVTDRKHLAQVIRRLRRVGLVERISRKN